jgi:hypothetical protein
MIKTVLAKLASGTASAGLMIILGVFIAAIFLTIPLLLVWGLQLLGFPVLVSFKSWLGSIMIMIFISYSKIGINKKSKDN